MQRRHLLLLLFLLTACGNPNASTSEGETATGESATLTEPACTGPVDIPDEALRRYLRAELGREEGELTCADLASLTWLEYGFEAEEPVRSLEGLQYAVNLESAQFVADLFEPAHLIEDLSPLADLTNLKSVEVVNDKSLDLSSLANLSSLNTLTLSVATLGDLTPIANLKNLEFLNLSSPNTDSLGISDLSFAANLTELTTLNLAHNQISDLAPLASLTKLESLVLAENQVGDLAPLTNLTQLEQLVLYDNQVADLTPLRNLTSLKSIDLADNQISNLTPLAENEGLMEDEFLPVSVRLGGNPLNTCPGSEARAAIQTLIERGVEVSFSEGENCG